MLKRRPFYKLLEDEVKSSGWKLHETLCNRCDEDCYCDGDTSSVHCHYWGEHDRVDLVIQFLSVGVRLV